MSSNTIDQGQKLYLYKEIMAQQCYHRPAWTEPDNHDLTPDTVLAVATRSLSRPELDAAQISYRMKLEIVLQEKSPLTPLMQKVFLQFEAMRNEFLLLQANTFDIYYLSLFVKLLDKKFISEKGKDPVILTDTSLSETCEELVKNLAKAISTALSNITIYFLTKNDTLLKQAQLDIKEILSELQVMDRYLLESRKEDSLQKTWGQNLTEMICLLDQCVNDTNLLPLLVQISSSAPLSLDQIFDPSYRAKQKQLHVTLTICLKMFLEMQESQLPQQKGKLKKEERILLEKCKELKAEILPQISLMVSLLEDTRLNTDQKIFNYTTPELSNLLDLYRKIEICTNKINKDFYVFNSIFSELESTHEEHKSPSYSWKVLIRPLTTYVISSTFRFLHEVTSKIKGLNSFQTRIEKCLSLCTTYPIQHSFVSKLDLIQTTHLFLITELQKTLESQDHVKELFKNHKTCFFYIRSLLQRKDLTHLFDRIKNSLKQHIQILETASIKKDSLVYSLMEEFTNAFEDVQEHEFLQILLTPSGSQTIFKKTDFHFLRARLKESFSICMVSFELESIPDPKILSKLKSINQVLVKFEQKGKEILDDNKYSEIEQLNILAIELFNIREDLEEINNFYNSFKVYIQNQVSPEKWMVDVNICAYKNFMLLGLFDQGNRAFFAYCADVFFDSISPQKEPITTPLKKIAAARASSPIEEIETEDVAASAPEINRFKDHKRDLETLCMKLKSYSLPRSEVSADFLVRQEVAQSNIQNIQCYILQIENLFCAFEEIPYQTAQALFSKLSNLIEQAECFVAAAKNIRGVTHGKHKLLEDLKALGITITPIVHILNGWNSTKHHYLKKGLSTETLSILKDLETKDTPIRATKKVLEGMMHEAYAFASSLLNSVARIELQDSFYETPYVTTLSQSIMPYLTVNPLLDRINVLVRGTQMSFSKDRTAYIAQVSDNENFDDKRIRKELISFRCRIIKEALSNLSCLLKPVSSAISYTVAESLLLNAALILEGTGFIILARLNIVGKDNRHIIFSKSELSQGSHELRSNHNLEKIFGELNLEVIEERRDIMAFFGNTAGGATRYLTQYKMGAAILLEEILFLNVIRKALQEGGLFKEEEHRRLKELFGSSENATPENVDIKLSQLMDIVNDKVARALELTAALLHHNSLTSQELEKVIKCR